MDGKLEIIFCLGQCANFTENLFKLDHWYQANLRVTLGVIVGAVFAIVLFVVAFSQLTCNNIPLISYQDIFE